MPFGWPVLMTGQPPLTKYMVIDGVKWFLERAVEHSFVAFASREHFLAALSEIQGTFTSLSSGLAWPYLLASLLIAFSVFYRSRQKAVLSARDFVAFLIPRKVYAHPSAMLDYRFYVITTLLSAILWGPMLIGVGLLVTKIVRASLIESAWWTPPTNLSTPWLFGTVFAFYLLQDFLSYWAHVACHKIPLLWAFHKIHHSADVLTPITAYRAHPIEFFIFAVPKAPLAAAAVIFYENISPHDLEVTTIFGISIVAFMFGFSGYHLQHSHLAISYGSVLNRIIMSPIVHQVHHSTDLRHFDKNFGVKFALWDWLFGTLYLPEKEEQLQVGLQDLGSQPFRTVRDLYFRPVKEASQFLRIVPKRMWRIMEMPQRRRA